MVNKEIIANLPEKPGCYLYYDENDVIIYVGKAKNLRKRVSSYFNRVHNYKTTQLVRDINKIEHYIVRNEKESLLLEENLIKKYKPKYNIILTDDKKYPYIVIEKKEGYRYKYIRNYSKEYFKTYGPFPDGTKARNIFSLLERVYPLKRCNLKNQTNPCLYYQLGLCSGECFKEVENNWYVEQINKIDNFFKGENDEFKDILTSKMKLAADNLNFEEANIYKKILESIDSLLNDQNVRILENDENIHFLSYEHNDQFIAITVLFYQFGKLIYKENEVFNYNHQDVNELVSSYIGQIYKKNKTPNILYIDDRLEINSNQFYFNLNVCRSNDSQSKDIIDLAKENAKDYIDEKMLSLKNNSNDIFEELKVLCDLKKYPNHIEMFDIANIFNEFVTGGCVVFKNGQASNNDFRKYNIDISEKDDGSRIAYCVFRRYSSILNDKSLLPDLIILDGGIIQVNAALKQLQSMKLDIDVIGLVKDDKHTTDHIYHPVKGDIKIEKRSQLYKKLCFIQEKVHNFTISHYRKRQINNLSQDSLSVLEGFGPVLIKKIRSKWPSNDELKSANINELQELLKSSKKTEILLEYINNVLKGA